MNYIGNFSEYIPKKLVSALLKSGHEKHKFFDQDLDLPETKVWLKAGYDLEKITFYSFDNAQYKDKIKLPEIFGKVTQIWFTRLDPGDMFPLHQDIYTDYGYNQLNRFCVMLQDYEAGHVFVHNGQFLENYTYGDTYQFNHSDTWHGACNIGLNPRLTMQIVSEKI